MSADILGTSWDQCRSMVQYSFTSTETRRQPRTATSTLTQLLNYVAARQFLHLVLSPANIYDSTVHHLWPGSFVFCLCCSGPCCLWPTLGEVSIFIIFIFYYIYEMDLIFKLIYSFWSCVRYVHNTLTRPTWLLQLIGCEISTTILT